MATYKDYSPSKFNDFMSPKCLFEDIKEYIPKDKVIKKEIIAELIKRDKPFMLIMPVSTICYQYSKMLKNHLQIIIPKKRPKFIYYDKATNKLDEDWKKKSATFDSVWVCWKMDLPQDIIFL